MQCFRREVEAVYSELYQICEYNYSKNVHTADAMVQTGQGNCFTLAEMACRQLLRNDKVSTVGIVLEAAPARRNTHAYCLAYGADSPVVAILDLIHGKVVFPHISRETRLAARAVLETKPDVLYRSAQGSRSAPNLIRQTLSSAYTWPDAAVNQRVYLPAVTGMQALRTIAAHGGMHQTLARAELDTNQQLLIPEIPVA